MAKTLILHRHSEKTPDGQHISAAGRQVANVIATLYYRDKKVNHIFWSPLIRALETAIAMMVGNASFDEAQMHSPVYGLGSSETMQLITTKEFRDLVAGDFKKLEALFLSGEEHIIKVLYEEAEEGLRTMFAQMDDDQLGIGVFHEPLISLIAKQLGIEDPRDLEPMEAIVFTMNDDGLIAASRLQIN